VNAYEQAKKLAETGLEQLTAALNQGKSENLTAYLAMLARFHHYSWGNVMLIVSQKPDATRVAGFKTWHTFGRFVRKGEKGIIIIAPMIIKPKDEERRAPEDAASILRFKAAYVFDVSQTDGETLPEAARVGGNPNGHTDRLRAFIASQNIAVDYTDELDGAEGVSCGGRIRIRTGLTPAEDFAVLVHELAHEMLHRRDVAERPSKTVRETEAEAVAFVVCQAIGLDTNTAAADYIQLYDGQSETLAASLERVQRTATAIIQAVTEQ
jgi:antirestriction protein ArdC